MLNYVNKVNAADQAVKTCRINVNAAARNVRVNPCNSLNPGNNQSSFENCPLQLFREAYGNWLHTGP